MIRYKEQAIGKEQGTSLTITKPTNLAVGDFMLAFVEFRRNITITNPAGWTTINTDAYSTDITGRLVYKIATAADVAAASFVWTSSTGDDNGGFILVFTGVNSDDPLGGDNSMNGGDDTSITISTISPDGPDSAIVFCAGVTNDDAGGVFSAWSMVTDNPSWAELVDEDVNFSKDAQIGAAWASRPEESASGNLTVSMGLTAKRVASAVFLNPAPFVAKTAFFD